jgi:hypothetical protein
VDAVSNVLFKEINILFGSSNLSPCISIEIDACGNNLVK